MTLMWWLFETPTSEVDNHSFLISWLELLNKKKLKNAITREMVCIN